MDLRRNPVKKGGLKMEYFQHFVDYETYCKKCEYYDTPAEKDPCNRCLTRPVNYASIEPVYFREDEDSRKKHTLM